MPTSESRMGRELKRGGRSDLRSLGGPASRLFPPLYRWRVRSRVYRWYTELREIDPRNRSDFPLLEAIEEARRIEDEAAEVEAPASYAQELYHLRLPLEFVQRLLNDRQRRAESLRQSAG